jgi:hypothetical protein
LNANNLYHRPSGGGVANCFGLSPANHGLLPLADNGGPTRTRAIGNPNSAAINAGDLAYCEALDALVVAGHPRLLERVGGRNLRLHIQLVERLESPFACRAACAHA